MEITYSKYGDYYLPDLVVSDEEPTTYGRFGRMRLRYLKEHRRATYILERHCAGSVAVPFHDGFSSFTSRERTSSSGHGGSL